MSKLFPYFSHIEEPESLLRGEDIKEYLYENYFANIEPDCSEIVTFYIDPHLNARQDIYEPLKNQSSTNSLILDILNDIKDCSKKTLFKIITKQSLEDLRIELNTEKQDRIVSFTHKENDSSLFKIGQFKENSPNSPKKLHDRWLLWKIGELLFGLHLGTSLNSIEGQDFTVTSISQQEIHSFWTRANHIWNTCTYYRGKK
jgi:hypothetical protein